VVLLLAVIVAMPAAAAEPLTRTYVAPVDRVWTATEAVLKQLGWEIDSEDWKIGYITTDSRDLAAAGSKDYGVYAKGTRHRLQLQVKAAGGGRRGRHVRAGKGGAGGGERPGRREVAARCHR